MYIQYIIKCMYIMQLWASVEKKLFFIIQLNECVSECVYYCQFQYVAIIFPERMGWIFHMSSELSSVERHY